MKKVPVGSPKMTFTRFVKEFNLTLRNLQITRAARSYGCTKKHVRRVLNKSKRSERLRSWLTDNHPELLTAKTQKREDAKTVREGEALAGLAGRRPHTSTRVDAKCRR